MNNIPVLENWKIINYYSVSSLAKPDDNFVVVVGKVYNDNRFEDGKIVRTSIIESANIKEGYVKTKNTTYLLGSIDKDYKLFLGGI